jgi:hypothetical protein
MKMVCNLADLLVHNGVTPKEAAEASKVDLRNIKNLVSPTQNWQLPRRALERLMLYAFESEFREPLFSLREHAIWSTFVERDSHIFRAQRHWDGLIEAELVQFIRRLGGRPTPDIVKAAEPRSASDIADSMKTTNCIFLGTPKSNATTELALALLAGAKPFDTKIPNRAKLVVQVLGGKEAVQDESAVLIASTRHGFSIAPAPGTDRKFIKVDWKNKDAYDEWGGTAKDAAVVVVCRRPLGTPVDVTTILIMGYSGLATQTVTRELTHGNPPLTEDILAEPAVQHVMAYSFDFRKAKRLGSVGDSDQRRAMKGSGHWYPPWDE